MDQYHFKSIAACVTSSLRWTRQSIVLAWIIHYKWYGWRTSWWHMSRISHVFNVAHPSPCCCSLPSSASSVPTVCGWSVCLRAQADRGIHRGIQSDRRPDKRRCCRRDVI